MFEADDTDSLRFVIDGESDIEDEFIRDMLRVTALSPLQILQDLRDELLIVRLTREKDYRLLGGPEFLQLVSANLYTMDDVMEFVVPKFSFLYTYSALVDTFLEIRDLPRVKVIPSEETLLIVGNDLVTVTTGYISDVTCRYRVQHAFGMGRQSNGMFSTQAILTVQDTEGTTGLVEVSWECDWRPTWEIKDLSEMIYTLLGATDFPKVIIDELYDSFKDAQFNLIGAPVNPHKMSGQWTYEVTTDERTDLIHITTYWMGEDKYGVNLWMNDIPLHRMNNLGGGSGSTYNHYFNARCVEEQPS